MILLKIYNRFKIDVFTYYVFTYHNKKKLPNKPFSRGKRKSRTEEGSLFQMFIFYITYLQTADCK